MQPAASDCHQLQFAAAGRSERVSSGRRNPLGCLSAAPLSSPLFHAHDTVLAPLQPSPRND